MSIGAYELKAATRALTEFIQEHERQLADTMYFVIFLKAMASIRFTRLESMNYINVGQPIKYLTPGRTHSSGDALRR